MKIFISHSSRDKWIARKLSEDLNRIDCETFLDEKDIKTGESIDSEINKHLTECDDFLLLLSPDSIKSHWVLIELGGALALKKKVIITLLYLGPNEIPAPISKYLARDINEIEKYYKELEKRVEGKSTLRIEKKITVEKKKPEAIEKGDNVQIISTPQTHTRNELGWDVHMDEYCGIIAKVIYVDNEEGYAHIEEVGGEFYWSFDWFTKVNT